jgi:hypothetical protein
MGAFETIVTVEDHGQIHVDGLPFAPGTKVEVTISPALIDCDATAAADRAARLFAALDKSRNMESVGPLRREELYDRNVFR